MGGGGGAEYLELGSLKMKLKFLSIFILEPGMMIHAWNPSTLRGPMTMTRRWKPTWATKTLSLKKTKQKKVLCSGLSHLEKRTGQDRTIHGCHDLS